MSLNIHHRFSDKVVAVTGGAQGLGEGIAMRFAREGARVAIIDLQQELCERVSARLRLEGAADSMAIIASVAEPGAMNTAVGDITDRFGRLDVWVNNAGIYRGTATEDISMREWQMMLDVNYTGVFLCTQAVAPVMKSQGSGRIINMSSIAGRTGFRNSAAYCSNKAAVIGLTRATAMDLAPYGVTVNAVCPGSIMTDMLRRVDADICQNEGWPAGRHIANKEAQIPLKRLGYVEDVAGVVAFLASDDASFITGQAIEVDGGELLI